MHDEFKLSFHYFRSNSVKYKHEKVPDYVGPLASLVAQTIKNLPAVRETSVQSLGWEYSLAEGMVTLSSILAWRDPMDRGAWWATAHVAAKSWTRLVTKHTYRL